MLKKGSPGPSGKGNHTEGTPIWDAQGIKHHTQTPFLNPDPFNWWYGIENVARVRDNGESCIALLDIDAQINTITLRFIRNHSLDVGPLSDLVGRQVTCVGLGNVLTWPMSYVIIWVQVDGVQGYDKDQIALAIPDLSNFAAWVPVILGTPTTSHIVHMVKEREIDALATPWVNTQVTCLLVVWWATATVEDDKVAAGVLDLTDWIWCSSHHRGYQDDWCLLIPHNTCEDEDCLHWCEVKCDVITYLLYNSQFNEDFVTLFFNKL